jgi:YVTN family beta-propeller protein
MGWADRARTAPTALPPPLTPRERSGIPIVGLAGRPFGLTVTPTGDLVVTEQDLNQAVHLDSLGRTRASIPVGHDPGDVVVDDAGTAFVSGFLDGTLSVVDLSSNAVVQTLPVSRSNAYRLALSKDRSLLYVTSTDGHLYTLNMAERAVSGAFPLNASQGLTLNRAGELYASSTSGTIWRLDVPRMTAGKFISLDCAAADVALARDDSELYVACEDGHVGVLDPTSLATKAIIPLTGAAPFDLAVSPDNAQLYVVSAQTQRLTIIDRATRAVVKTITLNGIPRRVAFDPRGDKAYVSNEGNWIDVIE